MGERLSVKNAVRFGTNPDFHLRVPSAQAEDVTLKIHARDSLNLIAAEFSYNIEVIKLVISFLALWCLCVHNVFSIHCIWSSNPVLWVSVDSILHLACKGVLALSKCMVHGTLVRYDHDFAKILKKTVMQT